MTEKEKRIISNIKKVQLDYPNFLRFIKASIIVALMIPLFIWAFYLIGHSFVFIRTDITAGESLSFYGSVLSFIGTVVLSALALWQNERANSMNQRFTKLQLEEYTPYLKILSFHETTPDPSRCPDTTLSVLSRSTKYVPEHLRPENIDQMKTAGVEFFNNLKRVPSVTIDKHNDIFWIIERGSSEPKRSFSSLDDLEKLTYKFIFKNESKAKIKEIIVEEVEMSNTMNHWLFKPYELHNKISELIIQDETISFNVNIYWSNEDTDLTKFMNEFSTDLSFNFNIITIGNNEQNEVISVSIWMGELFELTYKLL